LQVTLHHISKSFGQEAIIQDMDYVFASQSKTAILGINGSGKSTLLQIIATYMKPSKGEVEFKLNGRIIEDENVFQHVSYCAPYLEVIEEMNLVEFFEFHFAFKKPLITIPQIIEQIGLRTSKEKLIENFSSGMKQRVKLAQAIFADTALLLLDEPCSNLDEEGIALYNLLISMYTRQKTIIVASNDQQEFSFCESQININQFKRAN
jgi:ABC-type multidrug transport system ATPase subunit